jgi:hypothetical protein
MKIYTDHTMNDELGICRTRVIYALAGGERGQERNCGFSPCLLGQKAWRGVWKSEYHRHLAIGGTKHGIDTGY